MLDIDRYIDHLNSDGDVEGEMIESLGNAKISKRKFPEFMRVAKSKLDDWDYQYVLINLADNETLTNSQINFVCEEAIEHSDKVIKNNLANFSNFVTALKKNEAYKLVSEENKLKINTIQMLSL